MKKIQKLVLSLGVGLIVLTPLVALLPVLTGTAGAAPYSEDSVTTKAAAWTLGRSMAKCLNDISGMSSVRTLSESDAKSGDWGVPGGHHVGEYTGIIVEGTSSNDDKVDCNKVIAKTLSVTGITYVDALCGMGFTRDNGDCEGGTGSFHAPNSMTSGSQLKDAWDNVFRQKYLENNTISASLTNGMRYYIYFNEFKWACGDGEGGGFNVTDWNSSNDISDSHSYHLMWYDSGALADSYVVSTDKDKNETVTIDGWKLLDYDAGNNAGNDTNNDKLSCRSLANNINAYADDFQTELDADETSGRTQEGGTGTQQDIDVSCGGFAAGSAGQAIGTALRWIACPLVEGMSAAARVLDNGIIDMLCIDENQIFGGPSTCNEENADNPNTAIAYKNAWNVFRVVALGLLAIVGLIMILSQTMGLEIVDAYTIKKVLPRILIAAIAISLSWELMQFFVGLTNVLGTGVRSLIYAPFNAAGIDETVLGGGGSAVLLLTTGGAFFVLGPLGLLALVGTALLSVFVGFLVLILRNILIVLLIITAPIAIVAYILPNTQKAWGVWWDGFSKALLMFPLIAAFIAVGHVFAAIATEQAKNMNGIAATIAALTGFIAYFAPYFLIPLTLRFAGGIMGTLGGFANDRNRGAFDRLKKFRGGQSAKNMMSMKEGKRYQGTKYVPGSRRLAKGFNRTTAGLGTGFEGRFGMGGRGAEALDQTHRSAALDMMKGPKFNAIKDDDNALMALTYDDYDKAYKGLRDKGVAEGEARRAVNSARASVGFGRPQAIAAAQQLINTGTGYENLEELSSTLARAAGGNTSTATGLAGFANSVTKSTGRHDLAPGFGGANGLMQLTLDEMSAQQGGGPKPTTARYAEAHEAAWNSASLYQHANDKPKNIDAAIAHFTPKLTSASQAEREKAAVFFNELKAMKPNASGDVKTRIDTALANNASELAGLTTATSPMYIGDSAPGVADRETGSQQVDVLDPGTGNYTKTRTPATGTRSESAAERVERLSRTYERPDPNII